MSSMESRHMYVTWRANVFSNHIFQKYITTMDLYYISDNFWTTLCDCKINGGD